MEDGTVVYSERAAVGGTAGPWGWHRDGEDASKRGHGREISVYIEPVRQRPEIRLAT